MATTRILLEVETATLPASNPAVRSTITSSGGPTANTPLVTYQQLAFDASTDQSAMWTFRLPADWLSGGTLTILFSAAVNTGNVVMKGGLAPATVSSTLIPAGVYTAADVSATTAVGGTVGMYKELSWALTTTGLAAGRWLSVFLGRDADNAADTAAGAVNVTAVEFAYTS